MHKHLAPAKEVSAAPPRAMRVEPGHGPGEVSPDPGLTPGQPPAVRDGPRGFPTPPAAPGLP